MKLLVLGAGGMAGHVIALRALEEGYEVHTLSRNSLDYGIYVNGDVYDVEFIKQLIQTQSYDAVINSVGILIKEAKENPAYAVFINSYLPHALAAMTKNTLTKVIHLSTDCVFSGRRGQYKEQDTKDGELFYDQTKALGELDNQKDLTFRMSIIGPELKTNGVGLMHWFLTQKKPINGYQNVYWTGITTLTLAEAILASLNENLTGLYHLVNNKKISKFDLLRIMNEYLRASPQMINPVVEPRIDKSLINTRIDFSFDVPTYQSMMKAQHEWMLKYHKRYPHYEFRKK